MTDSFYDYLKSNLKIVLEDTSTSSTCGGECPGEIRFKVTLLIKPPGTVKDVGQWEVLSEEELHLSYL